MTQPDPAGARVAAFFDLDGTLIPGSANIPLAKAAFKAGFVKKHELARDLARNLSFMLIGASDDRSAEVRDRILQGVSGRPASEIEALADDFLDDLVATIEPAVQVVLDEHRAAGHELVLISASPTEIVQRFAVASGMDYGRGTTAERDSDGRYTGRIEGPFCYKEGKAEVLRALAAEHGYDLAQCYAYSDSVSDEPMMRAVGHPVAVNPDNALRTMALRGGWTVLETGRLRAHFEPVRRTVRYVSKAWAACSHRIAAWRGHRGQAHREPANVVEEQTARD
ncbi:MAG: HAD-IB family hydrolase [Dermatophilaceae bacterium]